MYFHQMSQMLAKRYFLPNLLRPVVFVIVTHNLITQYLNQYECEKKVSMQIELNSLEGLLKGKVLKTFANSLDVVEKIQRFCRR